MDERFELAVALTTLIANCLAFCTFSTLIIAGIKYLRNIPKKKKFPLEVNIQKAILTKVNSFYTADIELKLTNKTNRKVYVCGCNFISGTKTRTIYRLLNTERNTINLLENIAIEPNAPITLNGFIKVPYNFVTPEKYTITIALQDRLFAYDFPIKEKSRKTKSHNKADKTAKK